jgi:hypothetical protein
MYNLFEVDCSINPKREEPSFFFLLTFAIIIVTLLKPN